VNLPLYEYLFVFSENLSEFEVSDELDRVVEVPVFWFFISLKLCSGELEVHDSSDFLIFVRLLVVKVVFGEDERSFGKILGIFASFTIRSDADDLLLEDTWVVLRRP
jgi:hypothetical protein